MEQYGRSPDLVIQVLHRGQELFGYLPEEVLQCSQGPEDSHQQGLWCGDLLLVLHDGAQGQAHDHALFGHSVLREGRGAHLAAPQEGIGRGVGSNHSDHLFTLLRQRGASARAVWPR